MKVDYPNIYRTRSVRVAHIYDTSFHRASENFAIAGLLSLIQVTINWNLIVKVVSKKVD